MADDRCPECSGLRGLPRLIHDSDEPRECVNDFHKQEPVVEVPPEEPAPAAALPQPEQPGHAKVIVKPRCPYCRYGSEPEHIPSIVAKLTNMGPLQVAVVYCANPECVKIIGVFQPLGFDMMAPPGFKPN